MATGRVQTLTDWAQIAIDRIETVVRIVHRESCYKTAPERAHFYSVGYNTKSQIEK